MLKLTMSLIYSAIIVVLCATLSFGALLPPAFVNSVVAIGHEQPVPPGPPGWVTEGSGFLYGFLVSDDPDPTKRRYEVYLITNRHVVSEDRMMFVRLNPKHTTDQGQVFPIPPSDDHGRPTWFKHRDPASDIAGVRINPQLLTDRGIDFNFLTSDLNAADTAKLKDLGVSAGDPIFVLGFPMNLAGQQRNYVIVRPGAIARVSDLIESAVPVLLIDAHVFPGNSGGPVILQPSVISIEGTKSNNTAYLIGVVRAYIPYVDVAISPQTQRPRVTFEENSGLAEVVPVDRINEAIKAWRDSLPAGAPPVPLKTVLAK